MPSDDTHHKTIKTFKYLKHICNRHHHFLIRRISKKLNSSIFKWYTYINK